MASVFKRDGKGPWIIHYFDEDGRRRERSSRTTDKRVAERVAAKVVADVALRRDGVVDAHLGRMVEQNAKPIEKHVAAYVQHLEHAKRSPRTIKDARTHLAWVVATTRASRLSDLTLDAVEGALALLQARGLSARSINHRGGSARAFLGWCVRSGRLGSNPLRFLPRQAEALDRRRERRPLTDEEVRRLLAVAEERGRKLWYLLAWLGGLRLSELKRLRWGDVDLSRSVLVVRRGKAARVDEVPLHADLEAEIRRVRPVEALPSAPVFPTVPTNETRRRDFRRAGIPLEDEDGLVVDLHSLRVTLATQLARAGVLPQVAQRILRHSRYSTTLRFYTRLGLSDTAGALASLPSLASSTASSQHDPQQFPQQSEVETVRSGAI